MRSIDKYQNKKMKNKKKSFEKQNSQPQDFNWIFKNSKFSGNLCFKLGFEVSNFWKDKELR